MFVREAVSKVDATCDIFVSGPILKWARRKKVRKDVNRASLSRKQQQGKPFAASEPVIEFVNSCDKARGAGGIFTVNFYY